MIVIAAIQGMGTNQAFQGEPTNKTRINRIVNMEKTHSNQAFDS